jgi:hypothetical protein
MDSGVIERICRLLRDFQLLNRSLAEFVLESGFCEASDT